ncbi:MAG: efflux RND transporter permease subunit [Myxococcales bacterium]|nr:efflux RND transporter permease subunit [Myxococcales bacterium]
MSGGRGDGVVGWFVRNRVSGNLLMIFLVLGGIFTALRIKQEVFPSFELDEIGIRVSYPGASPEEVESGIVLALEEAVRGIDGIGQVRSTADEGSASLRLELLGDADPARVQQEVEQAVGRVRTLPREAENLQITRAVRRRQVLDLLVYGDVPETVLREAGEQIREGLLQDPGITQVDLVGGRAYEVHVEVPQETLRSLGLSLDTIAQRIDAASVDLPGGRIESAAGEILLRMRDRRDWAREFAQVPILQTEAGGVVRLGDIAKVQEGFEEVARTARYDGKPCLGLDVFRVGDQTPIGVSDAVRARLDGLQAALPEGVSTVINRDRSEIYKQRLDLLLNNALLGLVLVVVVLGLFLELRLAFWVTMGIPTSFLGGLLLLGWTDVSINMISMFAFIVALGIVVDDAIVVGENVHDHRMRGLDPTTAAIQGTREVSGPVAFAILTNVVAFIPLYFMPGMTGKIWTVMPVVVCTVFVVSWVECQLILPVHLTHARGSGKGPIARFQRRFADGVQRFIEGIYGPVLDLALRWRVVTVGIGIAVFAWGVGFVEGGRIGTILMPRVESDSADVTAVLPQGTPPDRVQAVEDRLVASIQAVAAAHGGEKLVTGVYARVDESRVEVRAYLTGPDERPLGTREVARLWREQTGPIPGVETLRFESDRGGPGSGASLTIELSHRDSTLLEAASEVLAAQLDEFPNVKDTDDGHASGKVQLDFQLTPAGASLGLTSTSVARQVRDAFYGAEALRQQRQRDEVKVVVRRPEAERTAEHDIETLLIRTPDGRDVPLREVATVTRGRAYTAIERRDGRRTVTVTGDVDPIGQTDQVMATLNAQILPALVDRFPGLTFGYEGRQSDMRESLRSLFRGFLLSMAVIYFLLAVPFRSYTQPLIVMTAIPFGLVGALLGHLIVGYDLSLMSLMGMVALCGVVVNDSLVLVEYANRRRDEDGLSPYAAIRQAGLRRFRPVILTTLTTFGGLAPMIFETSRQARFMIPMALSLGFGVLFATLITLFIVPCLYGLTEDVRRLLHRGEA